MAGRKLDRWELAGGELIARLLGGRADPQDTEHAPDGTHDFNIVGLANNRVVALEITSAADPSVISQLNTAFGREWSSPTLANNWMIGIQQTSRAPRASVRKVMSGMIPILELFERRGDTSVEVRSSPRHQPRAPGTTPEMHAARIEMFDLGVETARRWGTPEPRHPGAIYPTISAGTSSNPDNLNQLVADCAERKADKLRAASADERHLLVWIDSSHEDAELAFAKLRPPPPPTIPPGLDVVWLVGPTGGPDQVRIWRAKPPGAWEVCSPPSDYALRLD
ncbi:MAG: hypothetical protein ABSC56_11040 [Solirubrobacteraceae bacterium]|jgi:hypothetical protein